MSKTLTIRTDEHLRDALRRHAEAQGVSVSALARAILEDAVVERTLLERAGGLKGRLIYPAKPGDRWRMELREKNWRR